jgi:hypothetical protein
MIAGALVLCAASLCAFGAVGASAVEPKPGLTAVTCKEAKGGPETGDFATNHCETPEVAKSNFETEEITEAGTRVTGEAVETISLEATLFGAKIKITCHHAHITGKVTNTLDPVTGEHRAHGTEGVSHYTECEAHLAAKTTAEEACEIENLTEPGKGNKGTISTVPLTATTGPEHRITISTENEGNLTKFKIIKSAVTGTVCSIPTVEVTVTGTVISRANTTKHSHGTLEGEGTLKVNGGAAKVTGTTVGYMEEASGIPGNTVGLTTFTATEK